MKQCKRTGLVASICGLQMLASITLCNFNRQRRRNMCRKIFRLSHGRYPGENGWVGVRGQPLLKRFTMYRNQLRREARRSIVARLRKNKIPSPPIWQLRVSRSICFCSCFWAAATCYHPGGVATIRWCDLASIPSACSAAYS